MDEKRLTAASWPQLKVAHDAWPAQRFAVFQAAVDRKGWTCNIFLGDALSLAGMLQMRAGGKYYSANEVYKSQPPFAAITSGNASRGDIASMSGGHHVEVVTSVIKRDRFADGFCSVGAGRSDGTIGQVTCDSLNLFSETREIENTATKFVRVKS